MVISKSIAEIKTILSVIPDPEIPVITIQDLGILREVRIEGDVVEVDITPTYSGCPAMKAISKDIVHVLNAAGIPQVVVKEIYQPVWTTDWLSDEAREKLRAYGIAPPEKSSSDKNAILGRSKELACPHCGSRATELVSQFGSTACKSLYRCLSCLEPFDHFKCI